MDYRSLIREGLTAADITPLLARPAVFHQLVRDLGALLRPHQPVKVACVEGRGFLLGAAVAYQLGAGLVPLRVPGQSQHAAYSEHFTSYHGPQTLEVHTDAVITGEPVAIVDDWVETGGTALAAARLVERCGGKVVAIAVLADSSGDDVKAKLAGYNYRYLLSMPKPPA